MRVLKNEDVCDTTDGYNKRREPDIVWNMEVGSYQEWFS